MLGRNEMNSHFSRFLAYTDGFGHLRLSSRDGLELVLEILENRFVQYMSVIIMCLLIVIEDVIN